MILLKIIMLVCGIETSCDETGIALWSDDGLLGHVLHSQIAKHRLHGGVVPEIAARDHQQTCPALWSKLIKETGVHAREIDAVAYTQGPGLIGCLLTGQAFARGLALGLNKKCIGLHHLEGHLMSIAIGHHDWYQQLSSAPPFLGCLFSGGHCMLLDVRAWGDYSILGSTRDDAVGEAFDKVAKMMGLPYPGGPELAKLAQKGQSIYDLPKPMLHSGDCDMSFSGLKTAARNVWLDSCHNDDTRADLAASFEQACVTVLSHKIKLALEKTGHKHVVISGGVSANIELRTKLDELAVLHDVKVTYPVLSYCTDNGAMMALTGWWRLQQGLATDDQDVRARWPIEEI